MLRLVTVLVIFGILLLISIVDFKIHMIPDQLNMLLFLAGIWSSFIFQKITITGRVFGIFVVSIPFFIIAVLSSGGLGGGDIKLMAGKWGAVRSNRECFCCLFWSVVRRFLWSVSFASQRIGYKSVLRWDLFVSGIAIVFFR